MLTSFVALYALAALAGVVSSESVEKRQDIPQLLELASVAGVALPTDPAVILGLGDVAQDLAAALPTPSVLSVLLTAAPPSFISNIVHDRSFANSFQSAFAAGSSPSWFTALPTDVKSYLHTYSNFGGLAQAASFVGSGVVRTTSAAGATTASTDSTSTASATTEESVSRDAATDSTATGAGTSPTSNSDNGATRLSEALGASLLGVVGMVGLVVAL